MLKKTLVLILLFAVSLSGCSRTVTERVPRGEDVSVYFNFAGALDFVDNKYFMIISSDPNFQVPAPPDYEFVEPGVPPFDPQVDYYEFYKTWSGYVVVDNGIVYLVDGPFNSSAETYSRVQVGGPLPDGTRVNFQFRMDQIFGSDPPDTIYFDFLSVDPGHILMDQVAPPVKSIARYNGMIVTGSDEGSSEIDPTFDILDWSVSIE